MSLTDPPKELEKAPHFHGHRDRLREKFARHGPDPLDDYELLELLLYRFIPRRDTKPIAKALLNRFGSLFGVFGASEKELAQTPNLGLKSASDLKIVAALISRALKREVVERPVLGSWTTVIEYLQHEMGHSSIEELRVLFLDKKNRLIEDVPMQQGTVDHTPVYPREIIRKALEISATAIILVHNHPSGDPTPSRADIEMTKKVIEIGAPMNITVHDHIIVGKQSHASLRGLKLI